MLSLKTMDDKWRFYRKDKNGNRPVLKISKRNYIILGIAVAVIIGAFIGIIIGSMKEIPSIASLKEYKPNLSTKIYDINNELITQIYVEQRTLVPLSKIPIILLKGIVASEDERFYNHWGIDLHGIMRAMLINILHRKIVEGGSTITQQLARNLFLTMQQTFSRKIKEALLAIKIEYYYTKKEILEMYLNQIYFGSGAYGVESAARVYFGKHVEELNLPECAMLIALARAPNSYSPYKNPEKALNRRNAILNRLQSRSVITKKEAEIAKNTPIELHKMEIKIAPYFVEYIRQYLENTYGSNAVYKGGLKVHTTLDLKLQDIAQQQFNLGLDEVETKIGLNKGISHKKLSDPLYRKKMTQLQGAFIAMDPHTGYVKALIGGRNFRESEFNRAIQAKRQPGSAFKPFIYTTAINSGFTAADIILDAPIVFDEHSAKPWKPENFEGKFFGPTTLRKALTFSRNVITVKLLDKIGLNPVIELAHKMGIKSELSKNMSLALGTSVVSLLELTSAYCTFPNQGIKIEPIFILEVRNRDDKILEENKTSAEEVLKPEVAYILTNILQDVVDRGTSSIIRRLGFTHPAAGKTGTTDNFNDAWFVGFTPDLLAGIWVGYDDQKSLGKNMTGGTIAAPIWARFMQKALENIPAKEFPKPENIVTVQIDITTGLIAAEKCAKTRTEVFIKGTEPTKICDSCTKNRISNAELDINILSAKSKHKTQVKEETEDSSGF
ncbi:MAG: PBP1A family penicillin-binding protein [Candidatus Firestonebacteria bacterium]